MWCFLWPTTALRLGAAVFDYSAPLSPGFNDVTQNAGTVAYRVFDPARGGFVSDFDATGSTFGLTYFDTGGVVAWNNGSFVFCRIYDPSLGIWVKTNVVSGGSSDLRASQGVVAWSSGSVVYQAVYDASRRAWQIGTVVFGSTLDLRVSDGVVAWSTGPTSPRIFFQAYDAGRGQWVGGFSQMVGGTGLSGLQTRHGVLAWNYSSTTYFVTYDPVRGSWTGGSASTGSTSDLQIDNAVVAWSRSVIPTEVYFAIYDPLRGAWQGSSQASGQTFNLSIQTGTVFWTAGVTSFTRGYNITNATWVSARTAPFAALGISGIPTNPPLRTWFFDMSLGASTWSWNFGDGTSETRRAPYHVYTNFTRNAGSLTVTGPDGRSSISNFVIRSDISAPTGSIVINAGADLTTNANVVLALSAGDNSGVVAAMRFSQDGTTWTAWEPYATSRLFTLQGGNGTRTVFVQFRDPAENESAPASDSIVLDTTPLPTVLFAQANFQGSEPAGSAEITVILSAPFTRRVEVDYQTADGSAMAGSDYTSANGRLGFNAGQTQQVFTVLLANDSLVEPNETLLLSLSNPTNALPGPGAVLSILDDDLPEVAFSSGSFPVNEGAGTGLLTVQLNAVSGQTVSVLYTTTNGTASPGPDYLPASGQLTFLPGQLQQSIPVTLVDDSEDEDTESIGVTLSNPGNAVLGAQAMAFLNVADNDPPTVRFAVSQVSASENDGSISLQVYLRKPVQETVFVDFGTSNGTAVAGSDFISNESTLIFGPSQTNKPIAVTFLNDGQAEGPETFYVVLRAAVNATLGLPTVASITLKDDDLPRLTSPGFNGVGQFGFTLNGPPGQRLRVEGSTNLQTWQFISLITNTSGNTLFTDFPSVILPRRFYRVEVLLP